MSATIPDLVATHRTQVRKLITDTLNRLDWSLYAAARELDVTPRKLQSLISTYGLEAQYREHTGNRPRGRPRRTVSKKRS